MLRFISLGITLLALSFSIGALAQDDFRKTAPSPGSAPKIEIGQYDLSSLRNGLKVIVVENHKLPRISFQLFVDVPLHKENEKAGVASLAGQLLATGTKSKTKAQIDETVDFIGASLNTSGNGITASSLSKHADAVLALMAEILFTANFPKDEFDKLVKQTLSGLASRKDNPDAISGEITSRLRYGKAHPFGESSSEASVGKIVVQDCIDYKNTYFKPGNAYLIVVGDISRSDALAKAEKYFGAWKKGAVKKQSFPDPTPPIATELYLYDKKDAVQSVVALTYPLNLEPGTLDVTPVSVMNQILGGGSSGRLFKNLREDKGYTYGAYSSISPNEHIGYFNASANVRNVVTDSAISEMFAELRTIRETAVSDAELAAAKAELSGRFGRSLEQPATVAGFALNIVRFGLPADYYNTYIQRLSAVDAQTILAVAKKYIQPDQVFISVVGNAPAIATSLTRFDREGKVRTVDSYGNLMQPKLKMETTSQATEDPSSIVNKYLEAIGGIGALAAVKDVSIEMSATIQGMQLAMKNIQKDNMQFLSSVKMNGMTISEQIFDGVRGKVTAMGQPEKLLEGPDASKLKEQALIFPEMAFAQAGTKLEYAGKEEINGESCHRINVTDAAGKVKSLFFGVESGLKMMSKEVESTPQGEVAIIREYAEYKAVSGILFPHRIVLKGGMPVPLTAEVSSVTVNGGVPLDTFKVN